ncbi:MAG: long-chain fatty acid--CoA ligase [Ruminococcaceae bacterium]|nr:long-chain fatty acid--CoA ligase [Oscillospiraceae bacterium]
MKKIYNEKKYTNFRELVNDAANKFSSRTAFIVKLAEDKYRKISYKTFREHYYRLCTEFINRGFIGERIAVCGKNCYQWVLSYLASATVGVVVPIDKELGGEDIENFATQADCVAICADSKVLKKSSAADTMFSFDYVDEIVDSDLPIAYEKVDGIEIPADKTQVLIFTSGTTGYSKGVCLSQYNICANIHSTVSIVKVKKSDTTLSILPLHHTYECTLDCLLILSRGSTISYCESLKKVAVNIKEYSPTILVCVPELLKLLVSRIKSSIIKGCPDKYKDLFISGTIASAFTKLPFIIKTAIKAKVKKSLGGRMRLFIVGAAELETSIVEDFTALGIRTLQGYGLTECAPLLAGNSDFYFNAASTGIAIPGVELKIHEPNEDGVGEILAKGENIMLGYFNDPEATEKVFLDGWFRTGDLGRFDEDGGLYITGRVKNVIVTENGKNIYPEELETRLGLFGEIGDVIIVADKVDGLTKIKAKIFPNLEALKEKLGHIPTKEEAEAAIRQIIDTVNSKLPSYKHIRLVEILESALEKTTTRKIKRFGSNVS